MGTDLFNNKATKVSSLRGSGLVRWLRRCLRKTLLPGLLCSQLYALHLKNFTLYTWHLDTLHFSRHSLHFTLHFTLSTPLYTRHFALHNPHFIPYTLHSPLNTPRSTLVRQQGKNAQDCWNNLLHKKCFTSLPSVRWSLLFFQRVVKGGKIAKFRFWRETREHWGPIHPIYLIICTSHSRVPYTWIDPLHKKMFRWCGIFLMWGKGLEGTGRDWKWLEGTGRWILPAKNPSWHCRWSLSALALPIASCLANPHDSQPSCSFTYLELS